MDRTLMIGRQSLFLHPAELRRVRKVCAGALADYKWGEYADRFLAECLGVREIHTLDFSSYEGADLLHDLNVPIADSLKSRFDIVIEAGTIEHIFNVPVAIANLMQMTCAGGSIFVSTIANNLCGHGFYQFSPELFFRIFTAENGFSLGAILAAEARYPGVELTPLAEGFKITDPAQVADRVGVLSRHPLMIFFQARKVAEAKILAKPPQQSDYAAAWTTSKFPQTSQTRKWIRRLPGYALLRDWMNGSSIALRIRNRLKGQRQLKQFSFGNRRAFKRVW